MAVFLLPLIVAVNIPQTFKLFSSHECRFFDFFRTGKFSLCPSWIERFHHPLWVRFSTVRCLAKHLPHRIRNLHLLSRFHHVFQITFYFCMPLPNERLWNTFYIWCFLQGTFLYSDMEFSHIWNSFVYCGVLYALSFQSLYSALVVVSCICPNEWHLYHCSWHQYYFSIRFAAFNSFGFSNDILCFFKSKFRIQLKFFREISIFQTNYNAVTNNLIM